MAESLLCELLTGASRPHALLAGVSLTPSPAAPAAPRRPLMLCGGAAAPWSTPPVPRSPAVGCRVAPIHEGHAHWEGEAPSQGQWSWTPPPTSVRLQRPGAGGQRSLPWGRAQLWHPGPPFSASMGSARVWPPPLWWGRGDLSRQRAGVAGGGAALGACPLLKAPRSGCGHPQGGESAELAFQHPGQGWAAVLTLPSPMDSGLQDNGQRRPATPALAVASARLPGVSCSFLDLCLLAPPVSQVSALAPLL